MAYGAALERRFTGNGIEGSNPSPSAKLLRASNQTPALLRRNGTIMVMLVASFFSWWYGRGWSMVAGSFGPRLNTVLASFSVNQLVRTLFAPWRRIITEPGSNIEERFRAAIDNLFSRMIGFVVRLFVLLAAMTTLVAVAVLTAVELVVWPLLPLAIPGGLIAGLVL